MKFATLKPDQRATDIMDSMRGWPRHRRSLSTEETVLLGALVGAVVMAALSRRRCQRTYAISPSVSGTPGTAEPALPSAASASAAILTTEDKPGGRWARARVLVSRGFTPTVGWLLVIGATAGVYGWAHHPDTAIPQPPGSSVEVDFSPDRSARSPMTVGLGLRRDKAPDNSGRWQVTLAIDLTGDDLASPNWTLVAIVPTGVRVNGALDNDPSTGQVSRYPGSQDEAIVRIAPGPAGGGKYTALLIWDDEGSGPLRVNGANLVASLPDVSVVNFTPPGAGDGSSVPRPEITVERQLSRVADYAFLGGMPPDQLTGYWWSWKSQVGHVNDGDVVPALQVEARSATRDERSHSDEFKSGIAFGITAAALIAAVQESLNERRRRRQNRGADRQ